MGVRGFTPQVIVASNTGVRGFTPQVPPTLVPPGSSSMGVRGFTPQVLPTLVTPGSSNMGVKGSTPQVLPNSGTLGPQRPTVGYPVGLLCAQSAPLRKGYKEQENREGRGIAPSPEAFQEYSGAFQKPSMRSLQEHRLARFGGTDTQLWHK